MSPSSSSLVSTSILFESDWSSDVKTQVGSLSRSLISESLIIQSKSDTAVPYDMLGGDSVSVVSTSDNNQL